jgi:hypothetical protein
VTTTDKARRNILKVDEFWPNILSLYRENRLYFIFTFITGTHIYFNVFCHLRKSAPQKSMRQLRLRHLIVVLIMVLALGKQYKTAYFIPALMLLPLIMILTIRNLLDSDTRPFTADLLRRHIY